MPFRKFESDDPVVMMKRIYNVVRVLAVGFISLSIALAVVVLIFKHLFGYLDDRRATGDVRQTQNEKFERSINNKVHAIACLALKASPPGSDFTKSLRKLFPDCPPYSPPKAPGGSSNAVPGPTDVPTAPGGSNTPFPSTSPATSPTTHPGTPQPRTTTTVTPPRTTSTIIITTPAPPTNPITSPVIICLGPLVNVCLP